ncbi:tyrosine-type recombinase/integrase [Methyloradius palustris]|uniref:Uncharacterized protein n=1 Tax=Methyloradius palustris TaxID=2778876 RepID=A0A8D5G6W2_9PROT|nr:tyrosine-type recombinase/integrase [Methyloradius palustris]BCM24351.1 hypothetical protein ZMTM_06100 [Methyloradius palustris]
MALDPKKLRTFNIDIQNGIYQSDGPEDYQNMMGALDKLGTLGLLKPTSSQPPSTQVHREIPKISLKLSELVEKLFDLKKQLKPATAQAYKKAASEFSGFLGNPYIHEIGGSDITRYQEHLAKINDTRTIDNKIGNLSAIFSFAITQKYYFEANPALGRKLMSKKDRDKSGYAIFEDIEIHSIFLPHLIKQHKDKDPDFYYCILLGLISGCRISEITSLQVSQIKAEPVPHLNIIDSKTVAGIRTVPIPQTIYDELQNFLPAKGKAFKYIERLGKGSGNAVSQKFKRHMGKIGVMREGLVFHSLRKYFNNFLKTNKVQIEARCQMLGHELDNVNETTYANEYSIQDLATLVNPVQNKILEMIKYNP